MVDEVLNLPVYSNSMAAIDSNAAEVQEDGQLSLGLSGSAFRISNGKIEKIVNRSIR